MKLVSLVFALSLVGATSAHALEDFKIVSVNQSGNMMPPVVAGSIKTDITFMARSGGCTSPEDFELQIKSKKDQDEVTIIRTKVDSCEALVDDVEVTLSTRKLGYKSIVILNPVSVDRSNIAH